jgi:mono/diheme cytochrome c family protein
MNRYNLLSVFGLLALIITIPLYAIRERERLSDAQTDLQAQYIQNASVLYLEFCADCHGPTGEGIGLNPALNRLGLSEADPDMLFQIIARATHGSSMASWHLSEGGVFNDYQIRELVTLIRFADWAQIDQIATEQGLEFQDIATKKIEDISTTMLTEQDPHQCIACHEEPKVHVGSFGPDCVRCHTLTEWIPASLTRHTFRLNHGGEEVACETCHIEKYTQNTCFECHDHKTDEMADIHKPEGIANFNDCIACHPTGDANEGGKIWQNMLQDTKQQHSYIE